jgi:general secretion pathway protein A
MLAPMYAQHFRLRKEPFSIAPDPRFLYMSEQHREALAHLLYGVGGGGGFVLLTGEIGAGKTTVCRGFLEQIPAHCDVAYIFNPKLTVHELLATVCQEFRVRVPQGAAASVKELVDALNAFLLKQHAAGRSAVLIIDEAQSLAPELLEQLRLLTNLETHERKLLQIVLIGQPELREMLARPGLEQLAQRVIARYHLGALTERETPNYVRHRLAVAGGQKLPFEADALARIHAYTAGVPRRINLLADRALLGAYAQGQRKVDRATLDRAAREVFDLRGGKARRAWVWGLGAAAAAGAVGAVAAALWLGWPAARERDAAVPAAAAASTPLAAASVATARASAGAPALAAAFTPAGPVASAAGARRDGERAVTSSDDPAALLAALPRAEHDALRELAALWPGAAPGAGEGCAALRAAQLACFRARGGVATVRQLARPGVLTLRAGDGRVAHAVLLGLSGSHALLQGGGRQWRVALPALAALWRGEFVTLWKPPPGWRDDPEQPLGEAGRAWVAARLAGAGQGDARQSLRDRIWAFQVASGLEPDGVAGPITLMQLGRAGAAGGQEAAEPRLKNLAPA